MELVSSGNRTAGGKVLVRLKLEHRELDDAITELALADAFDQLEVQRMKKRKLVLKDRISKIEDGLLPNIIA